MLLAASAVAVSATSCDAGKQRNQRTVGPPIEILGVSVGPEREFPFDGVIQIAFDRYLLPSTVVRQSFVLVDSANMHLTGDKVAKLTYDPVARTVTLSNKRDNWLQEGLTYKLILPLPEGDSDESGLRAIDRAGLRADQKRQFAFKVGPKQDRLFEPPVSFCRDVLPIFAAKCSLPTCHGAGDKPAASLALTTTSGVTLTALNRIAQGSNTGARSSPAPEPGRVFGVDMPIIDPGKPGNSWLIYKLDLARPPVKPSPANYACTTGLQEEAAARGDGGLPPFVFQVVAPNARLIADDYERSVLSDFILGREMPFPLSSPGGYPDEALTFDEREKVRLWIENLSPGVALTECGGCGFLDPDAGESADAAADADADAGAPDAGDPDSGDASDQ